MIRYADDFIVTSRDKESLEKAQIWIQQWMLQRGLELGAQKTRISSVKDGFDFLGFNLRQYDGKLLIKPSKAKVLAFCQEIGRIINSLNGASQEVVINKFNPILRGFANYYKGAVSNQTFCYIHNRFTFGAKKIRRTREWGEESSPPHLDVNKDLRLQVKILNTRFA